MASWAVKFLRSQDPRKKWIASILLGFGYAFLLPLPGREKFWVYFMIAYFPLYQKWVDKKINRLFGRKLPPTK